MIHRGGRSTFRVSITFNQTIRPGGNITEVVFFTVQKHTETGCKILYGYRYLSTGSIHWSDCVGI